MTSPASHPSAVAAAATAAGSGAARDEAAFLGAMRHSRRVRFVKLALPAAALLMAAGFAVYSWMLSPSGPGISVDGTAILDGRLVMSNPKLNGYTRDNLPYSMSADRAIQDMGRAGIVELEKIDARLPVDASSLAMIVAERGVYDQEANVLDITSPLSFRTTDGLKARLGSARIDIGASELSTGDPVEIEQDGSRITADSLRVLERGRIFVFEKRVRMTIDPKRLDRTAGAGADRAGETR